MQLSEAQKKAVETTEGQVLLISCPGSGKTSTVVHRVKHMVEKGIPAGMILVLTFSKAAAEEMGGRYKALLGADASAQDMPLFATIHSFCFSVVSAAYGYTGGDILKEAEAWLIVRKGIDALKKSGRPFMDIRDFSNFASSCLSEISVINNNGVDWGSYEASACPTADFKRIYDLYENEKAALKKIDFDDMLRLCLKLFRERPDVLARYRERFRYLIVDEYQDTNFLQRDILYLLAGGPDTANLCVVGDDDQSIYRFRGARPEIMLDFGKAYPACASIHMDVNYRSEPEILRVARNLISCNVKRFPKDIKPAKTGKGYVRVNAVASAQQEAYAVAGKLEEFSRVYRYEDMAVLYRNNSQADFLSLVLMGKGIPFHGSDPVESPYKHWMFSDLMSFYRIISGKGGRQDMLQVVNKPNRYIQTAIFDTDDISREHAFGRAGFVAGDNYWKRKTVLSGLNEFYDGIAALRGLPLGQMIGEIRERLGYDAYLKQYADYRNMDVGSLTMVADAYVEDIRNNHISTAEDWNRYANSVNARFDRINKDRQGKGVTLSTMHRSKGLEWPAVFIIGANEGIVPSPRSASGDEVEEERRLFYVAVTRAKERLEISWAEDKDKGTVRSRFIDEMDIAGTGVRPRPEKQPPVSMDSLKAGSPVCHKEYGRGTVIKKGRGCLLVKFDLCPELKIFKKETFTGFC